MIFPYFSYILVFTVSFFFGGTTVWYVTNSSRKNKAKRIANQVQDALEDVDRNFKITIEMSFGVPGFARTVVTLNEKNE